MSKTRSHKCSPYGRQPHNRRRWPLRPRWSEQTQLAARSCPKFCEPGLTCSQQARSRPIAHNCIEQSSARLPGGGSPGAAGSPEGRYPSVLHRKAV